MFNRLRARTDNVSKNIFKTRSNPSPNRCENDARKVMPKQWKTGRTWNPKGSQYLRNYNKHHAKMNVKYDTKTGHTSLPRRRSDGGLVNTNNTKPTVNIRTVNIPTVNISTDSKHTDSKYTDSTHTDIKT